MNNYPHPIIAREGWLASIDDVAVRVLVAPVEAHKNRVLIVERLVHLDHVVFLPLVLSRGPAESGNVQTVTLGEIVGQWSEADKGLDLGIKPAILGIVGHDVVGIHNYTGRYITLEVHRSAGSCRRVLRAAGVGLTVDVAEQTLAGLPGQDCSGHFLCPQSPQELEVSEEESVIFPNRAAEAEAADFLHEHVAVKRRGNDLVSDLVRVETRSLIEEEGVAMNFVGPATADQGNVAATGAANVSRGIGGDNTHFLNHVRIETSGREAASRSTGFVHVDTVQSVIPRAVAGPVRLVLVDVQGREVARVVDAPLRAGRHRITWQPGSSARGLANGVYFAICETGGRTTRRRWVLMK